MKTLVHAFIFMILFTGVAFAEMPMPPSISTYYGCQNITIHWPRADSAQYHPTGYRVWMLADGWQEWTPRSAVVNDTLFTDTSLYLDTHFSYGVSAVYDTAESPLRGGETLFLPQPSNYDYFLIGDDSSEYLNNWYTGILDSLGLQGIVISDILPYCGDWLAELRLLWVVRLGNTRWFERNPARDTALANYLDLGARLYADNGWELFSGMILERLHYDYTLCIPYPFLSMHGVEGTFAEGLRYSFPDSLLSSNLYSMGQPPEVYDVIEDDVGCGCVDLAVNTQGIKAVINSQPLHLGIDNDSTGTRLEYFRRVLVFFDILTDVKENPSPIIPDKIKLSAYPNPFNSEVRISFKTPKPESKVTIGIFDITGRLIKDITTTSNNGVIIWEGKNGADAVVSSGVYFARMTDGENAKSIKLTFLK